jgi:RNA recognition motif-containing protein
MVAMDALAGLEELGFTEVPDVLASPLSGPSSPGHSSDGSARGGRGGGGGSDGSAEGEGRSVYVSNLAYAVSRATLARLFASCGEVRRVSIPLDPGGR